MKRTLITIVAAMFAAVASNAAIINVATNGPLFSNLAGTVATVTVTLTTLPGGETVNTFSAYGVTVGWDPTVVRVLGSNGTTTFGKASQNPIIAGLSGSPTPVCASSGPNKGKACAVITQSNAGAPLNIPGGTVVIGTLLLEVIGGDPAGTSLGLSIVAYNNNGITNAGSDPNFSTTNFTNAALIPEPATAALLGLGLVGLGIAGRRRA